MSATVWGDVTTALTYKGGWNADTNTPTLADNGVGGVADDFYIVTTAGTTSIDGFNSWQVGDWILNNGTLWSRIPAFGAAATHSHTGSDGTSKLAGTASLTVSATDVILGRKTAGPGAVEQIDCTAAGRALIDDASATAQRATLGLGDSAVLDVGTTTGTVAAGDDSRLTDARTPVGTALTDGKVWVGDGSDQAAAVALNGDATIDNTGLVTIANDAVTYAKMQNVSATDKLLGRSSVGAGNVEEIDCTAAGRALLDDASAAAQLATLGAAADADVMHLAGTETVTGQKAFTASIVLPKAVNYGILIDPAAPTYGWKDLLGEIHARGTGPTDPSFNVFRTGFRNYQFTVGDEVWQCFHVPHDYVETSDIYIHAHWAHNAANVVSGAVTWTFEASYAKGYDQGAFPSAVTVTAPQTASTVQYRHMIAEVKLTTNGQLSGVPIQVDGLILVRVSLSANTMSAATEPFLLYSDLHFQSTGMPTKNRNYPFYT